MEANETKVYVGNLPFSVGFVELGEFFSSCGDVVESTVVVNKFSGRSKGFGFVTFADKESAQKAIKEMDGKEMKGRKIKVSAAVPIGDKPRKEGFGKGRGEEPKEEDDFE